MTTVLPRNYWRDDRCAKAFWSQHELPAYRELMADTTAWLNPGPGERWLDLGCGAGRLCAALWQKSGGTLAEVTGLDVAALNERSFAKLRADVLRGGLLLSLEPGQVDKIRVQVNTKGDPKKGKELYLNTKLLACATCHKMEGVGGAVGPDLSRLWETMTVEKILEAIVDPSKEIKEGFQTYRLVTTDTKTYTGLRIKDDAKEVVIRDANGRDIRELPLMREAYDLWPNLHEVLGAATGYERVGHLFQNRFFARNIATNEHLESAIAYVWNNPVRAGLCEQADAWPWGGSISPRSKRVS